MPFRQDSITLIINAGKTLRLVAKKKRQYVLMKRRFTIMMLAFLFVSIPIGSSDKGWAGSALGW
ncbi:hypothetical protein F6X50_13830 [Dickeya dianthicola]|nr:hypothetical protein [Dickeya dianthicola]MZI90162.1 hypothetical protein [Dickeya dianthicola]